MTKPNADTINRVIAARAARTVTGSIYDTTAVNKAIASSNRAGRKIGKKEAALIHRVLRGRGD